MMVNDSQMGDPFFAQLVQDHEIAHSYFPFIWESMKPVMHLWMRVGQQH
jgi:hypothetical protein